MNLLPTFAVKLITFKNNIMIQNKLRKGIIIGLLTFLGTFTINAQSDQKQRPKSRPSVDEIFEQMDANEDGKLAESEVKGPIKNDFDKIDSNEDGFISKKELKNAPQPERK